MRVGVMDSCGGVVWLWLCDYMRICVYDAEDPRLLYDRSRYRSFWTSIRSFS